VQDVSPPERGDAKRGGSDAEPAISPLASWYPDPGDPDRMRWWDGSAWTDRTRSRASMALAARYRSLRWPARLLQELLALFVLVTLANLVSEWLQLGLLTRLLHDPASVFPEEAASADGRQALLDVLQLSVYGATAVAFLVWFHRAYSNLPALGMAPLEVGAGWAIGGWFVPILGFVRPKEIMNDIWRGSDPDKPSRLDGFWRIGPVPALVHLWWALFLLSWLLDRVVLTVMRIGPDTVESLRTGSMVSLAVDGVDVVLGVVALELVRRTTRRQQARAARLTVAPAPPSPFLG
jgi:Domain of unknown function (DUF4328)/Protein of unknown function (DUF2510)